MFQGEGRTVLFVSHDMSSISRLCPKSILLKNGSVEFLGETSKVIEHYLSDNSEGYKTKAEPVNKHKDIELLKVQLLDESNNCLNGIHEVHKPFIINIIINIKTKIKNPLLTFH